MAWSTCPSGLRTAIHLYKLAVDEGAFIGRKQRDSRRDFLIQTKTPERYFRFLRFDMGGHFRIIGMFTGDRAGRNNIGRVDDRIPIRQKRFSPAVLRVA